MKLSRANLAGREASPRPPQPYGTGGLGEASLPCSVFAIMTLALSLIFSTLSFAAPEPLSGLRVETVPPGAKVFCDGEDSGISPVTIDGLAPGDHLIVTRLAGYEESRKTISLEAGGVDSAKLDLRPATGLVLIRSNPEGADVMEGETSLGKTPLFLDELTYGRHRLTFRLAGYSDKNMELMIPDRTPIPVMVELSSDSATLNIVSTPTGAVVRVNGVDKGVTPVNLTGIPGGEAVVELQAEGYESHRRTLKLSAGQQEEIIVSLKERPVALTVVSIPPKARIYIENQFSGDAPVERKNLKAGSIRIRAELPGYRPLARTLELKRGDVVTEEFRLMKDTGVLLVTTRPAGASVNVDGQAAGVTEVAEGTHADAASAPLRVDVPAGGKARIVITKAGYLDDIMNVTVQSGATNEIRSVLKRVIVIDCEIETAYGTFSGALIKKNDDGSVKIETSPNKFKTIPAADIIKMTRPGVEE